VRRWIALVVVCFAMLMNALDQTIVNVALPTIQHDLGFGAASLAWVVDAYLVTFGGALLLAGRLGDLVGRKKVFLVGICVFTLASAACGLADQRSVLIAARAVQGVGAALSSSVILAIIVAEFRDPGERARAMSAYIFVAVGGSAVGLIAGGLLTEALSWHWIFLINLPIGVLTLVAGAVLLDENDGLGLRGGVDVGGAVTSTAGMTLAIYAIVSAGENGWGAPRTFVAGGAALALLAAFAVLERTVARPLMPPRILRSRALLISSLVRLLALVGLFAMFFVGALYLQRVLGYSTLRAGLAFLPSSLAVLILSFGLSARVLRRFGPRATAMLGTSVLTASLVVFAAAGEHTAYFPWLFLGFVGSGLAGGTLFMALLTVALADTPARDAGIVSGVVNVSQQVAAAVGIAVLGAVSAARIDALQRRGEPALAALVGGYRLAFVVAAVCGVAALVACLALPRPPKGLNATNPRSRRPSRASRPRSTSPGRPG
jgi:EmrB/QacA subfamily drug resistance transporter